MKVYFDTCAINELLDDNSSDEIIYKLLKYHEVFISMFNIIEIAATKNEFKRDKLFNLLKRLSKGALPLTHPGEFLIRSVETFLNRDNEMEITIGKAYNYIWDRIIKNESINDKKLIDELIYLKNNEENWFNNMHKNGRPQLQFFIDNMPKNSIKEVINNRNFFIRYIINNKEFLKYTASELLKSYPNKDTFKGKELEIITSLEPWRFYLCSILMGIYNIGIRNENYSPKRNAGSVDTQQSCYLACTDIFVTQDKALYRILRASACFGFNKKRILKIAHLKKLLDIK